MSSSTTSNGLTRVPTYIPSLDKVLNGGLTVGSTILVVCEPGAGAQEMAQTSTVNYVRQAAEGFQEEANIIPPEKIYYITQKMSKETFYGQLLLQFSLSLENETDLRAFEERVKYIDFGESFFSRSIVPPRWYTDKSITEHLLNMPPSDEFGGFTVMANMLGSVEPYSIVYLDSLTPYLSYFNDEASWRSLLSLSYGLSRIAKKQNVTYIIILGADVLPTGREQALISSFDGVFDLRWQKSQTSMNRQRQMYFEKYAGVLPTMSVRDVATYNVSIAPGVGFEISNLRRVT